MPYVYSTMSADVCYNQYDSNPTHPSPIRGILIKGGSGVATKHLVTPLGVRTQVTDEELSFLLTDLTFLAQKKNGFLTIMEEKKEAEVVVADGMQVRDASAPITPEDFSTEGGSQPDVITGKKK